MSTLLIAHRINTVEELVNVPFEFGIEVDLRDSKKGLILSHDPFKQGESFEDFLKYYGHKFIILNIKSERIEYKVLESIKKNNISSFFFLDSSFPMIVDLSKNGVSKIAARISEYESIETIKKIADKIDWIWLDSFTNFHFSNELLNCIGELNLKTCLVSPELQGRKGEIELYSKKLIETNFKAEAICTKLENTSKWASYINL